MLAAFFLFYFYFNCLEVEAVEPLDIVVLHRFFLNRVFMLKIQATQLFCKEVRALLKTGTLLSHAFHSSSSEALKVS